MNSEKENIYVTDELVDRYPWQAFRDAGMLWWINMILHTFGWAICVEVDEVTGIILRAYPARVKFRGFDEDSNTEGYIKVSKYISIQAAELLKESQK